MNTDLRINRSDIFKWFEVFRPNGDVTEIRCIDQRKRSWSGYFKTAESVINALEDNPDLLKGNVFQTFNAVHEGCYERLQKDKFLLGVKSTSDEDIVSRDWVFIDIDPIRPSDTNATDEQERYARETARKIIRFLATKGFSKPVAIASANGAHLYYRCNLKNTRENTTLCENFIKVMRLLFNDDIVKIDSVIFNASRFAKLPGTMSGKGNPESTTHPQRWCQFLNIPEEIVTNERGVFEELIKEYTPEAPAPSPNNNFGRERFDLQSFISKYGIPVKSTVTVELGTRYILEHCLFNPEHKGKDAMIFQYNNGCLAYKCFHDSCSGHTWKEVREKYEPDAYSRRDYDYSSRSSQPKVEFVPEEEDEKKGRKWMELDEIPFVSVSTLTRIGTGIQSLDSKIGGGTFLHNLSILTGPPASGKTSLFGTILMESVQSGFKTAIFSGGLSNHFLRDRILLVAAGVKNISRIDNIPDVYAVNNEVRGKITKWLEGKLFIRNSAYNTQYDQFKVDVDDVIELGAKNIILDNIVTVSANQKGDGGDYKDFIQFLYDRTRNSDIHIWLSACSINFSQGVSGANEFYALADNVLNIRRVDREFRKFTPREIVEDADSNGYTNVIEIVKNQFPNSHTGEFCGLYHETATKRMAGIGDIGVRYGWDDSPEQYEIPMPSVMPLTPSTEFEPVEEKPKYYDNESKEIYNNDQDTDIPF